MSRKSMPSRRARVTTGFPTRLPLAKATRRRATCATQNEVERIRFPFERMRLARSIAGIEGVVETQIGRPDPLIGEIVGLVGPRRGRAAEDVVVHGLHRQGQTGCGSPAGAQPGPDVTPAGLAIAGTSRRTHDRTGCPGEGAWRLTVIAHGGIAREDAGVE